MKKMSTALLFTFVLLGTWTIQASERVKIIQLRDPVTDVFWQPLTDGVRNQDRFSTIQMSVNWSTGVGSLQGELVLNNGKGFASYRALSTWNLSNLDVIEFFVRGDGRSYRLLLKDGRKTAGGGEITFQQSFDTVNGQEILVRLPLKDFKPIQRGQPVEAFPLELSRVVALGLQINDGLEGPFRLEFGEIFGLTN